MRRTTRRTTAARVGLSSLLLAGSWAAFGLTPAATAAPDPAPVASGAVLAGMERDLGLTPAEAKARLAAEKEATAVEKKAQRAAGAAYGGSWFDAEKGALVVAVSDSAAAEAVTEAGASVRLVEHSAKTLDAAKERIDGLDAPRGVAGWRVDPQANSVVVSVVGDQADGKAVRGFVERARAAGPVEVETVAAAPETFAAGTVGGDPYYTGNVRCSIGFSVHGGFVTAGHCGLPTRSTRLGQQHDRVVPGLLVPRGRHGVRERRQRLVDRAGRARLGHRLRPAGARLGGGAGRRLHLPVRLHDPLALRHGAGQERDRQLQPGRGPPDDQDQRLRRGRRLGRLVHQRRPGPGRHLRRLGQLLRRR
ncbi:alpha-lytic protease prodomain-containing protein [Actinomadura keratinilytica]